MSIDIKKCPFCGADGEINEKGEAPWADGKLLYVVECSNPYCVIKPKRWGTDARWLLKEWNTRTEEV